MADETILTLRSKPLRVQVAELQEQVQALSAQLARSFETRAALELELKQEKERYRQRAAYSNMLEAQRGGLAEMLEGAARMVRQAL